MNILRKLHWWVYKFIVTIFINLRWAYFHVNPAYQKFWMTEDEAHFQHMRTNTIHSNYYWSEAE